MSWDTLKHLFPASHFVYKSGSTYYARKRDGSFLIENQSDFFTAYHAAWDDINALGVGVGGSIGLGEGTMAGSATKQFIDSTNYLDVCMPLANDWPLTIFTFGEKLTTIQYTGTRNGNEAGTSGNPKFRLFQLAPSKWFSTGTSAILTKCNLAVHGGLNFDINRSAWAGDVGDLANFKKVWIESLSIRNETNPNPPTSGSVGLLGHNTANERCTIMNLTINRFDKNFRNSLDHLIVMNFFSGEFKTAGLELFTSPYQPIFVSSTFFFGSGDAILNSSGDANEARTPIFMGILHEGDPAAGGSGQSGYTQYPNSTINNPNHNKMIVLGLAQRGQQNTQYPSGGRPPRVIGNGADFVQIYDWHGQYVGLDGRMSLPLATVHRIGSVSNSIQSGIGQPSVDKTGVGTGNGHTTNHSAQGFYSELNTGSTNSVVGDECSLVYANVCRRDWGFTYRCRFQFIDSTNYRGGIWLTDLTAPNQLASDTPVGNYIGLRASPGASGNFVWVTNDGTTTQTKDTNIPVDTSPHVLVIRLRKGLADYSVTLELWKSDMTDNTKYNHLEHFLTDATSATEGFGSPVKLPTETQLLTLVQGLETKSACIQKRLRIFDDAFFAA